MKQLIMLVGLRKSGKTYIAETRFKDDITIVNSPYSLNHLNKLLEFNDTVLIDGCNLSYKARKQVLMGVTVEDVQRKALIVATPPNEIETCQAQYLEDLLNFQIPTPFEGWDEIDIAWNHREALTFDYNTEVEKLKGFYQDNPHHSHTLGNHLDKTLKYLVTNFPDSRGETALAAILHDIGKVEAMSYTNNDGTLSKTAHYYGHENASSYLSLFYSRAEQYLNPFCIKVAQLIRFHMQVHDARPHRVKIHIGGEMWYEELLRLAEADRKSH